MAILVCTFGCKGAGEALRVVGAAAVVAARVGEVAAASAAHQGGVEQTAEAPTAPAICVELLPPPGAMRAVSCGGRVLVQDPQTGFWHG